MAPPPKLLVADPRGRVLEHPSLLATVRQADVVLPATEGEMPLPLPAAGRLVHLPGRLPVGVDPETGELELVREMRVGKSSFTPSAVGALLPPGYTRTFLPGEVKGEGPMLPQWAYTAAAWSGKSAVVWALRTDARRHWNPERYSTVELPKRVEERLRQSPDNRVLRQLRTCALVYRCFTSQNIFYGRDEGALPASVMCNARCVGCISDQPPEGPPASHARMDDGPMVDELAEVGARHLEHAPGRTMVSFGQGCEGEPLTRYRVLADAIRRMRVRTRRGSININTNASLPHALDALFDAGLDAVRVSLNSAVKDLYEGYYKPVKYQWEDVEAAIGVARSRRAYVALNLLTFPGVTDREGEVEALETLVRRYRVDQIQTRSLCIDPVQYLEVADGRGAGGPPLGIPAMLARLQRAAPWLRIGNFARGLRERHPRLPSVGSSGTLRRC